MNIPEHRLHYKIFAADTERGEIDATVKEEADNYAKKLSNLGYKARVKKEHFANPNYTVIYYKINKKKVYV